ncbi:MAG: acyloxyacyl hydrolase, partial [Prevotellaceae bacterium]|nr:acyloxyacyl hydrolase [Prevotellaceae bacterium]
MKGRSTLLLLVVLFTAPLPAAFGQQKVIHRIGLEYHPEYIFQTAPFLRGMNAKGGALEWGNGVHLKYAFRHEHGSQIDRIFGGAYQGIGIGHHQYEDKKELGAPWMFYVFQGGRIARFSTRLSLNYEWNLGLSFGWHPYDENENPNNRIIGSPTNAYLNAGIQLVWAVLPRIDLVGGWSITHFSNGNTRFPNAGLNSTGLKLGVAYNFDRTREELEAPAYPAAFMTPFPRHISYDLTLFGAWHKAGVMWGDRLVAAPGSFGVFGFNFSPMYNFSYRLKAGVSLDGVYDSSTLIYTDDEIIPLGESAGDIVVHAPAFYRQLALGLSGRVEYVMPYFTVGAGFGGNV